jgi:polyribonucleotide nucleotidyltransferase
MLGEKSIKMVLPQTEFPYVIRLNSEVFSSDGSTSQASICAASLALMSAGVPISKHIAGIAIGGIFNHQEGDFTMCDISGLEDQFGNLDLKISGTTYGICATQMDTKNIMGLTIAQLEKLFATAKEARLQIINKMTKIIASPAKEVASNVTKVKVFQIPTAKIGEIIGNGGKTIN